MSDAFVELGLLVVVAFALGLLVGWLAWASAPKRQLPAATPDRMAPPPPTTTTGQGLHQWQAKQVPTDHVLPQPRRWRLSTHEPTVTIGPRGWMPFGDDGGSDGSP